MTAQVPETLIFEDEEHDMCAEPLGMYFHLMGIEKLFRAPHTACWRGYMGKWEVKNERLYLVDLNGHLTSGESADIEAVFPGFPGRVFAHWFSGKLRLPQGKMLKYVHGGYGSRFERDLLLEFEGGILKSRLLKVNGKAEDPYAREGYSIGGFTTLGGV